MYETGAKDFLTGLTGSKLQVSFNGFEPVNFTGPMNDATKQDAIADQGSSVSQQLRIVTENAADAGHVTVTYVDQNNA